MKMKIIGIFVCMSLLVTALSATGATNVQTLEYVMENNELELYTSTPANSPFHIIIKIVAQVTFVYDEYNILGGAIKVGDEITGKYTYNSRTPDSEPDPHQGKYEYTSSPFGIELKTGEFVFKTNPNDVKFRISIGDDCFYTGDSYIVFSYNNSPLSNGIIVDSIYWHLNDRDGNALSSDVLPITAPVLSDWPWNELGIAGYKPGSGIFIIYAKVTKVTKCRSKTRDVYFTTQPILFWLLERFPNIFLILRQLLEFL